MNPKAFIYFILLPLSISSLLAQNCPSTRVPLALFHANQVRCLVGQRGYIFPNDSLNAGFRVPFQGAKSPATIFAAALWLGGKDCNGQIKLATATYYNVQNPGSYNDFWAGPLDSLGETASENCNKWDKIWTVTRNDILAHLEDLRDGRIDQPNTAILSWPAVGNPFFRQYNGFDLPHYNRILAPFFDANQDGKYTPQYGDYPLPKNVSNQTIPTLTTWCIFNDNGGLHTSVLRSTPLQAEIHLTTWAFDCDTNRLLNRTVFTAHKVINKGLTPIDSMSIGFWTDFDIGCPDDDAIGCSPSTHTFYGYNAALQEPNTCFGTQSVVSYRKNPPAQAVTFLNKPLSKFIAFNGGQVCDGLPALNPPTTHSEYFNLLNGRWRDGSPLTYGGAGYQTGGLTRFMFPDDPHNLVGWSFPTAFIGCSQDKQALGTTHIGLLAANDTVLLDAAWSFHQDTTSNAWQNVTLLRREVASIQTWYDNRFANNCSTRTTTVDIEGIQFSISPNPTQNFLTLNFKNETLKQVRLINIVGQIVLNDIKNDSHSTILDISHLAKGLYIMETRFENGKGQVQKIMKF